MTESSADKRIDDLWAEMHRGFNRLDVDVRELRSGIGSPQRLMIGFFATTLGSIVAGIVVTVLMSHDGAHVPSLSERTGVSGKGGRFRHMLLTSSTES